MRIKDFSKIIPDYGKLVNNKDLEIVNYNLTVISKVIKSYSKPFLDAAYTFKNILERRHQEEYQYKQVVLELWDTFENEIKTKNRYFPKSDFLEIFKKCAKHVNCILQKNKTVFRARKIEPKDILENKQFFIEKVEEKYNENALQIKTNTTNDIWDFIKNIPIEEWNDIYVNDLRLDEIQFWGFNSEDSDAPPQEKSVQGRANPKGISYLYIAQDTNTAISEIQPTIGQLVSVASIKVKRRLKLFDFNFYNAFKDSPLFQKSLPEIKEEIDLTYWQLQVFFDTISELFSRPSHGITDNYFATQYLSEYIKSIGFDGIRYKSSLRNKGTNIVLFDTKNTNYEIMSTSLHKVENVTIKSSKVLPK